MTRGIAALGADKIVKIMLAVVSFNAFTPDNDPYKEHDCAILEVDGVRVLWKIDYYDLAFAGRSPDPADPDLTLRLLTVMLAEEHCGDLAPRFARVPSLPSAPCEPVLRCSPRIP